MSSLPFTDLRWPPPYVPLTSPSPPPYLTLPVCSSITESVQVNRGAMGTDMYYLAVFTYTHIHGHIHTRTHTHTNKDRSFRTLPGWVWTTGVFWGGAGHQYHLTQVITPQPSCCMGGVGGGCLWVGLGSGRREGWKGAGCNSSSDISDFLGTSAGGAGGENGTGVGAGAGTGGECEGRGKSEAGAGDECELGVRVRLRLSVR